MKSTRLCLVLFTVTLANLLPAQDGYWWTNNRHRNPTKGGWVSNGAYVEEGVFIAPSARVEGSASVTGSARIYGNAVVRGQATVEGNARVYGNAVVEGNAMVGDEAQVFDQARIGGDAFVGGTARIGGHARIATGQITEGFQRPPQPAEEVAAARRAREETIARQAAADRRNAALARLGRVINAINAGVSVNYPDSGDRYSFNPGLKLEGDRLEFATTSRYGEWNYLRKAHVYVTETDRGTAKLAEIRTSSVEQDRTSRFDKIAPYYFEMQLMLPENSVRREVRSPSDGRHQEVRSYIMLKARTREPLLEFKEALEALQKL